MSDGWGSGGPDEWFRVVKEEIWRLYFVPEHGAWKLMIPSTGKTKALCGSSQPFERAEELADLWITDLTGVPSHDESETVEWYWVLTRQDGPIQYCDSGTLSAPKGTKRSGLVGEVIRMVEESSGVSGLVITYLYLKREETS